ncbi:chaplin [Streptomyces sp. NPDC058755]|uniref:chaplin n=1 Tax=Streptomyces sp. NPDC058755 TaxID=3346624 RepID=UPI0036AB9A50
MRQTLSKGMVVAAAATGMVSLCGSHAFADTGAQGAAQGSPGVLSGNTVQVPVDVPVNVCGNSVDAAGALNPAFGNSCANTHGSTSGGSDGAASSRSGGSHTIPSPRVGGHTTVPPHGDAVHKTLPAYGGGEHSTAPLYGGGDQQPGQPPGLAHTGGDTGTMLATSAASVALIAAGAVLYRRSRTASGR